MVPLATIYSIGRYMNSILNTYDTITLEKMKKVRLMNRIDTKYVTTTEIFKKVLIEAKEFYFVQYTNGERLMPYHTLYYDTTDCNMYLEHLHGRKRRQKLRIRSYEITNQSFLEIKNKNNKGRTEKIRVPYNDNNTNLFNSFVSENSLYPLSILSEKIENKFFRITLVNRNMTERLTVDTHLKFHNFTTDNSCQLNDIVVIELKRSGNTPSPIKEILRRLHIHPANFSKYCIGLSLTDNNLKNNRFKPRLHKLHKMCNITCNINF